MSIPVMIGSSRVPDLLTSLAISVPKARLLKYFQARMLYGLVVPDGFARCLARFARRS
jgi:hypothetical protein